MRAQCCDRRSVFTNNHRKLYQKANICDRQFYGQATSAWCGLYDKGMFLQCENIQEILEFIKRADTTAAGRLLETRDRRSFVLWERHGFKSLRCTPERTKLFLQMQYRLRYKRKETLRMCMTNLARGSMRDHVCSAASEFNPLKRKLFFLCFGSNNFIEHLCFLACHESRKILLHRWP